LIELDEDKGNFGYGNNLNFSLLILRPVALIEVLMLQAERVRDAAWGCDWVGTPVPFQNCIRIIIAASNKEVTLTAGKFVPVKFSTMANVRLYLCVYLEYNLLSCDTV
jgi:hypothetical protein